MKTVTLTTGGARWDFNLGDTYMGQTIRAVEWNITPKASVVTLTLGEDQA